MKTKKLLERLAEFASFKGSKQRRERDAMKVLLRKLKKRQKALERQVEGASGQKKKRIKSKIQVIKAQRKKGIERYKELRAG